MTSVWRVAEAGRIERQHVPVTHPRARRPVEKGDQFVAQIADAVRAGKGGRMEQDAGVAILHGVRLGGVGHYATPSLSPRSSKSCSHRSFSRIAGRISSFIA